MTLTLKPQPIPIELGDDGIARMAETRVRLETILEAYAEGLTAEEISCRYTTVQLYDIYFAIGYYLKNRYEVDQYLRSRREQARTVREKLMPAYDLAGLRQRIQERARDWGTGLRPERFERITFDPGRASGSPSIRNLELPVAAILGCLGSGMTVEDMLIEWPELEVEDLSQALGYAAHFLETSALAGDRESGRLP
jgi:uncharacterized protein (DUF433 family)